MTEEAWLNSDDVTPMLDFLYGKVGERKFRLFGCACCRRVWHIYDAPTRNAVETAERFADGVATKAELAAVAVAVKGNGPKYVLRVPHYPAAKQGAWYSAWDRASVLVPHPRFPWTDSQLEAHRREFDRVVAPEWLANIPLLRDIFGNPFRPVSLDPAWRTSDAVALARQMYDSRDFGVMPILADALQDAGCGSEDVLNHCRDTSLTHVRGCWVVDLVLGKG